MTDFNTSSSGGKLPLTLSNLLAGGENGRKVAESICLSISAESYIFDWLCPHHIFWNMGQYLEDGFLYLMHADGTDYFKIGKSIDPGKRLKQIYPKMPFETRIVGTRGTNYMSLCERMQHSNYQECRANGEWFQLHGENLDKALDYFLSPDDDLLEARLGQFFFIDTPDSTWDWQCKHFHTDGASFYRLAREAALFWSISANAKTQADSINAYWGQRA